MLSSMAPLGALAAPPGPPVMLPVLTCIYQVLLTVWNFMPVNGQAVVPQGQHTRTMMAMGDHLRKIVSLRQAQHRVPQTGNLSGEWVGGSGGFLEGIAHFNPDL